MDSCERQLVELESRMACDVWSDDDAMLCKSVLRMAGDQLTGNTELLDEIEVGIELVEEVDASESVNRWFKRLIKKIIQALG